MLSEKAWEQFADEGYLRLGQVATDDQLEALQTRMDDIMLGRVRYSGMFFQLDTDTGKYGDVGAGGAWAGPTLNYRKIQTLERDPLFLGYMQHPLFREITRRIYGEDISIYRAMFMNKPALRGTVLPYHQDAGAQWGLDRDPKITVWTALDAATIANGCMQVIPGSHKHGLFSAHGHTVTAEQEAQFARDEDSIFLEARAGEAILLDNLMLHRSGVNTIDCPRRAFSVCYMDAATRTVSRAERSFPQIFGEGALRPEEAKADLEEVAA
ncbi:MAG TPA: phytanoyl-CoA dioxygenase family protein [Chthonomonadaceae bacterium]|nr:phytanoyl-CoA dioxygenase family protein [Chthonomonadaceae bacterium]